MNTTEVIAAEICGAAVLLGLGIGYPWLWLHYARMGVLRLAAPPKPKAAATDSAMPAAGEAPAGVADPAQQIRPAA